MRIKSFIKCIYKKLNPAFVAVRRTEEKVDFVHFRLNQFEDRINKIKENFKDTTALERAMLLTEPKIYCYLYLNRYIHSGDILIDLECGYGTGDNLLVEVSPVNKIICMNTIMQFTNLGKSYYNSDLLEFKTGTIESVSQKVQGICALNTKHTGSFTEQTYKAIYESLDSDGFFAIVVNIRNKDEKERLPALLKSVGFTVEEILYQSVGAETLRHEYIDDNVQFVIARRGL